MLFPKGLTAKQMREKRKNEIKKKDREFQNAGEGKCEACGHWVEQRTKHHLLGRRHKSKRWDDSNTLILCTICHNLVHQKGSAHFLQTYDHLNP